MKFGYFDDNAKEYVITSPKTPLPWINYLGCEDFFSLVSNTCGGYSFYKDAKLLRLTRYRYNNVPGDSNGHYYYIKERNTIWNPGWMPTKTDLDSYECHHGIGYSIFKGSKNDLAAELTDFVPIGSTCEINKLTMTNHSKEEKHFSIFSYVEFCLWNAMDDMTNLTTPPEKLKSMVPPSITKPSTGKEETITLFTPSMLRLPDLIQVVMHFLVHMVKIRLLKLSYPAPAKILLQAAGLRSAAIS